MKENPNKSNKYWKLILTALLILTLLFIWGNSCLTREQSSAVSDFVMRLLGIDRGPHLSETVHGVRKTGHFLEFFALGVQLSLYAGLFRPKGRERLLELTCCGMLVPIIDETIQIFSGRNPQIVDVWIDVAGFTSGGLVVLLILWIGKVWKRHADSPKS